MDAHKLIIVPKNKSIEIEFLNSVDFKESDLIILKLDDSSFYKLWNLKVFSSINKIADVNIDDFEDESIHDVNKIYLIINYLSTTEYPTETRTIIDKLIFLFKECLVRKTGIYFYF